MMMQSKHIFNYYKHMVQVRDPYSYIFNGKIIIDFSGTKISAQSSKDIFKMW